MTLEELLEVKRALDDGVIISKVKWAKVLDTAIEEKNRLENEKIKPKD